ncbi:TetR/AcrR family transcriptional regulator [Nocardiopsis trehalosi]|uniref:TetR/AcrR family transcriptional regulator n=1 Tax=Nocardiopsis trehalosi TaxID=109329 RepID=UPI00082C42CD|nr:TetR family transcriptional regulator [Nocardiopsis trehalosi]
MARTTPGATRQRLLDEALRLFSTRGYDATTVADIQVAAGLAPGSGALYKHFASKEAVLHEAVRRNLAAMAREHAGALDDLPADPRAALRTMARAVWGVLAADRDLVRVMIREFGGFPDLFEAMWRGVVDHLYRACAAWVADLRDQGRSAVADPDAAAAVIVASLTYAPILDLLIGHTPGDVDPERFLAAWLDSAVATLRLDAPA